MKRHEQRDAEAGGPGYGNLDTRKRAWKAPDGTVVEKRTRITEPEVLSSWGSSGGEGTTQILSPPISDEGRLSRDFQLGLHEGDQHTNQIDLEASSTLTQQLPQVCIPHPYLEGYIQSALPTSRPNPSSDYGQPEYHPVLQPDTASSFNMPYTTALDYNWLFNLESATASGFGLTSCAGAFPNLNLMQSHEMVRRSESTEHRLENETERSRIDNRLPTSHLATDSTDRQNRVEPATLSPASSMSSMNTRERRLDPSPRTRSTSSKTAGSRGTGARISTDVITNGADVLTSNASWRTLSHNYQAPLQPEKPLSMLRKPDLLPRISQVARAQLLVLIETANPSIPDQCEGSSIRDHPLLEHESLQIWLDLFFTQFNTAYPLIHMPTFDADEVEPLLLLSLILLGATYGDKNAHQLAVCIHDVIRPLIFAHAGFSPRPELWTLQTILLVECFGKSRAGQKQHDFSHLFHGLLINLIRRSDCQSINQSPDPPPETPATALPNDAWRQWACSEQKKRLALLCFMWDTQHAVLFCQSLCMSAFELRCAMPCAQSLWESPDANSWATQYRCSQRQGYPPGSAGPMFLPTLKAYLSPTEDDRLASELNALSLILVLHGIMSIAWDMQRRDQTALGVNSIVGTMNWRSLLSRAYDRWKADFDRYCKNAAAGGADTADDWKAFAAAYKAVYQAAQALLHMDFLDVQIYAGARHILGRPVQQQDYVRSSRIVKRWATKDKERAAIAAWHAANMLQDVLAITNQGPHPLGNDSNKFAVTYTNLFHVPWCLYLATVTAWAFHHAKPARKGRETRERTDFLGSGDSGGDDSDTSDEIVWDAQKEMDSLIREMVGRDGTEDNTRELLMNQGRKGTYGLVWVVADRLSKVRWGIVHAGVSVLRGLVPTRLINQYT